MGPHARAPADDEDEGRDRALRQRLSRRRLQPHRGSLILTLGILSIFVCPLILGPIAWVLANTDLAEMEAGRMDPEGESNTRTGRTCGMVGTCLGAASMVLGLLFGCLWFGFVLSLGTR